MVIPPGSPQPATVLTGSSDETVRIWDAEAGSAVGRPLEGHTDYVQSIVYSPDGRYIISGSDDKTIQIWDAGTGSATSKPLEGHAIPVSSVAHSPDGQRPDSEGWVRDSEGGLLYWIPNDCRTGLHSPALLTISSDVQHSVSFSQF